MQSVSRLFQSLSQKLSPRTGRFSKAEFATSTGAGLVKDAVKFTNEVRQGDKLVSYKEAARVDFRNGSSLVSNGEKVTVLDSAGRPTREFAGSVDVSEEHVLIKDKARKMEQSFGADGSNLFFDGGRIVELSDGRQARGIFPNGHKELGLVQNESIQFANGDRAVPIFSQDWLIS